MLRRITVAAIVLVTVLAAGAPFAEAGKLRSQYRGLHHKVVARYGESAAGRNIVKDGVRTTRGSRSPTRTDLRRSMGVLRGMLELQRSTNTQGAKVAIKVTTSAPRPSGGGGGSCGAIPGYIVQRESGGNPGAVNPTSGAFGCYQLLPGHFDPGGRCHDLGRDQAGQDACAGRLWNGGSGSSNWAQTR